MALFSSKGGSSSSVVTTTSTTDQLSTSFGDLSTGNVALKDSVYNGFTGEDLQNVLSFQERTLGNILGVVNSNTSKVLETQQIQASPTADFFKSANPSIWVIAVAVVGLAVAKRIK